MRPELDDAGLRHYLLGLLAEAEAEVLEEAYFRRPDVWERVRGAEDDLLDDYAAGRLAPDEKAAFECRYLASPVLRERVVTARALRLATSRSSQAPAERVDGPRPTRWALPVALAAGLVLALLSEWNGRPRPPEERSAAASPGPAVPREAPPTHFETPAVVIPSAAPLPRRQPPARPIVLALSPVLLRGGQQEPATRRIPAGTETLLLELEGDRAVVPPTSSALEAKLETVEGESVWRGDARSGSDAARPSLVASVPVPATKLAPGDYLLTLSLRDVADGTVYRYFFRIIP